MDEREKEREEREKRRKQERLQKRIVARRKLEERARKSVKRASLFEITYSVFIAKKIKDSLVKIAKGESQNKVVAESLAEIRKYTKVESKKLQKELIKDSKKDLKDNAKGTLDLISQARGKKITLEISVDVLDETEDGFINVKGSKSNAQKEVSKKWKKYIKSKSNTFAIGTDNVETFFTKTVQNEIKDVVDGNTTVDKSCQNAIKKLSDSGVKIVEYDTGVKRNVDVWVRQQMQYAEKESSQDINNQIAKELGVTIFEFDAHANARPSHKKWQGKRYDLKGKKYPSLHQLTHGEEKDYGCKHFAQPVWDEDSPYAYSKEDLKNIDTKPFEFNGKQYEGYDARQHQRKLERDIRALKREKLISEEMGYDTKEINAKLRQASRTYTAFSDAMGDRRHADRLRIAE